MGTPKTEQNPLRFRTFSLKSDTSQPAMFWRVIGNTWS